MALLLTEVSSEGIKKIQERLRKLAAEHRAGYRHGSVISSQSAAVSDIFLTDWDEVKREVEDVGIPASAIDANRAYIQRWLKEAVEAGEFDEDPNLVHQHDGAQTPKMLAAASLEVPGQNQSYGKLPAPSSSGFRSSEPTVVAESEGRRLSVQDDETIDPLPRPDVDDEPPSKVSLEAGPSVSRKGTDLFDAKWREISDLTGGDPDGPPSLKPTTPRRKSSGLSSLMFKLFSSGQRIIQAASDGNAGEVSRLLGLGLNVDTKDKWGWTAMSMAAYGGHEEGMSSGLQLTLRVTLRSCLSDRPLALKCSL